MYVLYCICWLLSKAGIFKSNIINKTFAELFRFVSENVSDIITLRRSDHSNKVEKYWSNHNEY